MDTSTSLSPSIAQNTPSDDSQPAESINLEEKSAEQPSEGNQKDSPEKLSIQEFILSKYHETGPIYATKPGFLLGLPSSLERIQAKLLSQTVQRKAHTFQLLTEVCEDPNIFSRPLAKFSVQTLNQAVNTRLTLRENILNQCMLNYPFIATVLIFFTLLYLTAHSLIQNESLTTLFFVFCGYVVAGYYFFKYLEGDHCNPLLGRLVVTNQQKKQLLEYTQSLVHLEKSIIEARSELTRLEEDIKARKEEASNIPKPDELYVTLYMLLQTVILKTGESQTNTCDLIREALKKAQEHPSINRIPLGDTAIKGIMAKARATFTPAVTDRGPKDQIATDVRKIIEDVIKSSTIVK